MLLLCRPLLQRSFYFLSKWCCNNGCFENVARIETYVWCSFFFFSFGDKRGPRGASQQWLVVRGKPLRPWSPAGGHCHVATVFGLAGWLVKLLLLGNRFLFCTSSSMTIPLNLTLRFFSSTLLFSFVQKRTFDKSSTRVRSSKNNFVSQCVERKA